tara:strand:+ start:482 stop:688 length:207 start_codon:yes stop_codon:yes gene_type:complete
MYRTCRIVRTITIEHAKHAEQQEKNMQRYRGLGIEGGWSCSREGDSTSSSFLCDRLSATCVKQLYGWP